MPNFGIPKTSRRIGEPDSLHVIVTGRIIEIDSGGRTNEEHKGVDLSQEPANKNFRIENEHVKYIFLERPKNMSEHPDIGRTFVK